MEINREGDLIFTFESCVFARIEMQCSTCEVLVNLSRLTAECRGGELEFIVSFV